MWARGWVDRPARRGEAAEPGAGERPSTSGEENAQGGCGARHGVWRLGPQLRPLRLTSAESFVGARPSRARDWPPGSARCREQLGEAACVHWGQGGLSPPRALPVLQREARVSRPPACPSSGVSCSPRQSLSQLVPQQPGGGRACRERPAGPARPQCTPVHGHATAAHAAPPGSLGHHQGTGSRALTRPRSAPSGAELRGPRPGGAAGCPQRMWHLLAPSPRRAPGPRTLPAPLVHGVGTMGALPGGTGWAMASCHSLPQAPQEGGKGLRRPQCLQVARSPILSQLVQALACIPAPLPVAPHALLAPTVMSSWARPPDGQ